MLEFVLVAEGKTDEYVIPSLVDRVIREEGDDWIREYAKWQKDNPENSAEPLWQWAAIEESATHLYTKWTRISQLGNEYKNKLRIFRRPGEGDRTAETRKAIALCRLLRKEKIADALILVRDLDKDKKRDEHREAMLLARGEAREKLKVSLPIVLASPNKVIEVWMLNGFVCETEWEEKQMESLRQQFGFDVCLKGHQLHPDDAKDAISRLITDKDGNQDFDRREKCWAETDLNKLRKQGKETFLEDFLDEVKNQLLPLLTGKPVPRN